MKPRVPDHLLTLRPYTPGRPIEEVERELGLTGTIKVASNENALGPSPAALAALSEALPHLHRYPDGGAVLLARKLAARLGVEPRQILFGNGSNEIIELLVRAFAGPGREVVMSRDAFLIYQLVARAVDAEAVQVAPRTHHHDLAAMAAAITPATSLVFVASPNNPTGTIVRRAEWREFLARVPAHVMVAVDQAYVEFVDDPDYADAMADLATHANVMVLRTFSKIYGLAGLRIGYGVGDAEIVAGIGRLRQPFNVNSLAQVAAMAALDDDEHVERSRALVREGRIRFARALSTMRLPYVEGQANFVLVEVGDGARVTDQLLRRGVIVRPMDGYGMPEMIRITYGTAEEDARCLAALGELVAGGVRGPT